MSIQTRKSESVLTWLVAATFIVILNETTMVNAIPRLMVDFAVSARAAQWLSTSFMLTTAVIIPLTGWFLQRVTTRTAYAVAMTTFCVGSLAAALAPTFGVLLAARIVQAGGGAVMMPLLMTTLMTVVPEQDRGRVMGRVMLAMSVAPALGPTFSGVIQSTLSWRWMFGLVLPVAVVISVVGFRRLENQGEPRASTADWLSVALAALGFGSVVYGLSQLGAQNAVVPPGLVIGFGAVAVAAFVGRQLQLQRTGQPLLDLRTLTRPAYAISLGLMVAAFMAMIGSMILLPLYLQDARHLTALQTGLLVAPGGLAMGLLGPKVGQVFDRFGARPLVVPGSVGILAALLVLTRIEVTTSVGLVLAAHVLLMVSLAAVFTPAFTIGLGVLPPQLYSHGSSLLGTSQQVAASVGTAVVVSVMSSRAATLAGAGASPENALVGGMHWAFAVGAIVAVAVVVLGLAMPNRVSGRVDPTAAPEPEPVCEAA